MHHSPTARTRTNSAPLASAQPISLPVADTTSHALTRGGYDCFTPTPVAHVRWPLWSKIDSGGGAESALCRLQLA
jgi:hypothetical protein